jgi:hypothetical protein
MLWYHSIIHLTPLTFVVPSKKSVPRKFLCLGKSGCDFVVEYTNKQINKSPFSVSANVFSFAHRLMCICLDRKVILLANTQIHITK